MLSGVTLLARTLDIKTLPPRIVLFVNEHYTMCKNIYKFEWNINFIKFVEKDSIKFIKSMAVRVLRLEVVVSPFKLLCVLP